MKNIISLARPAQWVKNIFIILPLFFDEKLFSANELLKTLCAFIAFSLAASSIYCFNDILDVKSDKLHPKKCKRPIASGKVSLPQAYTTMFVLITAAVAGLYLLPSTVRYNAIAAVMGYYILNILYCVKLKHIAIIDTFVIATGFVIRVFVGGIVAGIWISQWIILMTFLLSLFLAFAKRRDDVIIFNTSGMKMRKNIGRYNIEFLNNSISIISAMTMISYIMWTMSQDVIERFGSEHLYITAVFVLLGMLRYLQLAIVDTKSGSPTNIVLKDRVIHLCVLGWVISFVFIIYLLP